MTASCVHQYHSLEIICQSDASKFSQIAVDPANISILRHYLLKTYIYIYIFILVNAVSTSQIPWEVNVFTSQGKAFEYLCFSRHVSYQLCLGRT